MKRFNSGLLALLLATFSLSTWAGGLLTNTNQHIAFNRMMSREGSIGIDGVYYNPAGVAFLGEGHHLSLNWQMAIQSRTIRNSFPLFANNTADPSTQREFRGHAFAPVLPSVMYAYNHGRFSFQANLGLIGGGGKCLFDDGLGSFEKIVSQTAVGAVGLASAIDQTTGRPLFTSEQMFGTKGNYSFNSFMRGRQYYYGLSVGVAYRASDHLSVFAGVRGIYVRSNYYGYVRDIKIGAVPLYTVLDPSKTDAADIELNCDQSGTGFTPILGIDYKTGRWNFSAKYEMKTRIRLRNEAVNHAPSIGNLSDNLVRAFVQQGVPVEQANAVMSSPRVVGAMTSLKQAFDTQMEQATGEYADGKKIAGDIPALLTLGVGYRPIDPLRVNVGFHYFFDKQASAYQHREDKLSRGTMEWNAGAEYDLNKTLTVSAGWQNTSYGLTDEYMDDKSFVVSSNSVGCGAVVHLSEKTDLSVAYFHTFYGHKKTTEAVSLAGTNVGNYESDYTRNNNVIGVGLDIKF